MILDEDAVKAKQLEEEKRKMSALRGDSEEGSNSKLKNKILGIFHMLYYNTLKAPILVLKCSDCSLTGSDSASS